MKACGSPGAGERNTGLKLCFDVFWLDQHTNILKSSRMRRAVQYLMWLAGPSQSSGDGSGGGAMFTPPQPCSELG